MDFDPNKPGATKKHLWATYVPDRRPQFKMYAQQNFAKNSMMHGRPGILYKWNEESEQWDQVHKVEKRWPKMCERCGSPFKASPWGTRGGHFYSTEWNWHWFGLELLCVCRDCRPKR
jgi:hypothetical protein